jgi:hypothetical protein
MAGRRASATEASLKSRARAAEGGLPRSNQEISQRLGNSRQSLLRTTASEAQSTALKMLGKLKQSDGILCSAEPSTLGMLLARKPSNLAGTKKLVGFNMSQGLMEGSRKGRCKRSSFKTLKESAIKL